MQTYKFIIIRINLDDVVLSYFFNKNDPKSSIFFKTQSYRVILESLIRTNIQKTDVKI